jgi:hypothetical protein
MSLLKRIGVGSGIGIATVLLAALVLTVRGLVDVARADPGAWFVTPAGSGNACTQGQPCSLPEALNKAVNGDMLYLAAGTYTGSGAAVVTVTQSISLYGGWDGSTATPPVRNPAAYVSILDGQGQRRGIYIAGAVAPTVDGCTVVGGNASNCPNPCKGGGIYSSMAMLILANNVISGNIACTSSISNGLGGGIYVVSAGRGAAILSNRVLSNVASTSCRGFGGGIWADTCAWLPVVGNSILSNTASITGGLGDGGGIGISSSQYALVDGNVIAHNVAQGGPATSYGSHGGGFYASSCRGVTVTNNLIEYNAASVPANGQGGGAYLSGCNDARVAGNLLQGNLGCAATTGPGAGRGGGFSAYGSRRVFISANRVLSNIASSNGSGFGGGFYFSRSTSFTMTNNIVAANHAGYAGGGIAFEADVDQLVTGTLLHNTIVGNDLGAGNGRIGIYLNQGPVTLVMTNNIISGHTYGVNAVDGTTVTLNSTLLYANTSGDTGGPGNIVNTAAITGQNPLLTADYHLNPGSPAIDAGVDAGVATDMDGEPRPFGLGYDIGADEEVPPHRLYLPRMLRSAVATYTRLTE